LKLLDIPTGLYFGPASVNIVLTNIEVTQKSFVGVFAIEGCLDPECKTIVSLGQLEMLLSACPLFSPLTIGLAGGLATGMGACVLSVMKRRRQLQQASVNNPQLGDPLRRPV
jgi:hypothetical protein